MCIIIAKKRGVKMPTKETMEICYDNNPDGAGFSYLSRKDKKIHISKGYMTFESFYNAVKDFDTNDEVVMHFRIGTQGGNTQGLTHPFPLTSDFDKIQNLEYKCDCAVAHNGIIQMTSSHDYILEYPNESDTTIFIAKYLNAIVRSNRHLELQKWQKDIIEEITPSRFVIQTKRGLQFIGDWIEDEGLYYSNSGYTRSKFDYRNYKSYYYDDDYYYYGKYYGGGYCDDYGVVDEMDTKEKSSKKTSTDKKITTDLMFKASELRVDDYVYGYDYDELNNIRDVLQNIWGYTLTPIAEDYDCVYCTVTSSPVTSDRKYSQFVFVETIDLEN